jgi:hypothetical protein
VSEQSPSAEQVFRTARRPRPIALANRGWQTLQRLGLARTALDEQSLIAAARRAAGLHDFGAAFRDDSTREPMRRLLAALEQEARLHPLGRAMLRSNLVRALVNRLRLEQAFDLQPEIDALPVTAPVFIVGLQRTGTTLLHRLLACEPCLRPLLSWEALNPAPFPASRRRRAEDGRDPRMRLAELAERGLRYLAPEFFAIHPIEARAPEEDVLLLDITFVSPTADATLHVPSYSRWFEEVDQRPAYRYLERILKLLLWQRPGRYLGKTPHHLEHLDVLLEVFPDARIIQTHRDPLRVVASFCSMISHGRAVFSDHVDPRAVGEQLARKAVRAVTQSMAVRDRVGADRFLDVAYADLVVDPLKQVRRIYDFAGLSLSGETEASMQSWIAGNPQDKHGRHRYRLEDFGLERGRLEELFDPYCRRFGVARD